MAGVGDDLVSFVREALDRGCSRDEIRAVLLSASWPHEHIDRALDGFAEVDFAVPVPRPRPYVSARDTFVYMIVFSTLGISAFHFGSLVFELIDWAFPDPLDAPSGGYSVYAVRQAIAALVVAFPIYLVLTLRVNAAVRRDLAQRSSKVRKWLTYMTLFVAAVVLLGDLTGTIYALLAGELTVRFVLKSLTVFAVAGAIFGYYLWDLREEPKRS